MTDTAPVLPLAGLDTDSRFLDRLRDALRDAYRNLTAGTPATLSASGKEVVVVLRLSTSALIHHLGRRKPEPAWNAVDLPALVPVQVLNLSVRHARLAATVAEGARDSLLRDALNAFRAADRELSEALLADARHRDDLAEALWILAGQSAG
ncbi:MAG: hypothetical protein ABR500_05620 [Dermatophilaceae bacterium]